MTRIKKFALLLMMLCVLLASSAHNSQALRHYQLDESVCSVLTPNALGWLSGAWESQSVQSAHEMHWSKPGGGTLLGFARDLSNDQTMAHEFMRIHQSDGSVWLTRKAGMRPETTFKLTRLETNAATFENQQRTFPQRILYQLEPDNSLCVRLEGASPAQFQQSTYKRVLAE